MFKSSKMKVYDLALKIINIRNKITSLRGSYISKRLFLQTSCSLCIRHTDRQKDNKVIL